MLKKFVEFNVICTAAYRTTLQLPDDMDEYDEQAILEYVRENLDQTEIHDLEWVNDRDPYDAVNEWDLKEVYEEEIGE